MAHRQPESTRLHPAYTTRVTSHINPSSHMRRSIVGGVYHHACDMDDALAAYVCDKYEREGFEVRLITTVDEQGNVNRVVCAFLGDLHKDRGQENNVRQPR